MLSRVPHDTRWPGGLLVELALRMLLALIAVLGTSPMATRSSTSRRNLLIGLMAAGFAGVAVWLASYDGFGQIKCTIQNLGSNLLHAFAALENGLRVRLTGNRLAIAAL